MTKFITEGNNLIPASNNHIGISNNGSVWDLIPKPGLAVGQIFSASPGLNYPYPTKTILVLTQHGERMMFELQDLMGGDLVAYNGGTLANLNDAVLLVGSWVTNV